MSDKDNVVNLGEERIRRDVAAGQSAYERGEAFRFHVVDYSETNLGFIGGTHPVVLMFADADGICLTEEATRMLYRNLGELLESPHAPWNQKETPK